MQPAPLDAQCALHAGFPAHAACERCGNFMCVQCSDNGARAQCPTCRERSPAGNFPFQENASFSELFNHAWERFKADPGTPIIATIIFFGISMAGGIVSNIFTQIITASLDVNIERFDVDGFQWEKFAGALIAAQLISMVIQMLAQAVALGGFYRVLADMLAGRKGDVSRYFSRMKDVPKFVTVQILTFLFTFVPTMVLFGGAGLAGFLGAGLSFDQRGNDLAERLLSPMFIGPIALAGVLVLVLAIVLLPLSVFALPELVVSDATPMEAIGRAWQLGNGQRLRIIGYSFMAGLIVMAGFFACCVGVLPAMPLAYSVVLSLFLAVRNSSGLPPADHS